MPTKLSFPPSCVLVASVALFSGCSGEAELALYTRGHADIALELVGSGSSATWDAYLSAGGATIDGEVVTGAVSLEDVAIRSRARFERPSADDGAFDALCVPHGSSVPWLPQGLRDAAAAESPFLGISATAEPSALASETIAIRLLEVESPSGNGAYALWRDAWPPQFFFSSCDGIDAGDVLEVPLGHDHYNMAFSELGRWLVTYEVSARLGGGAEATAQLRVHYVLE